MSATLRIAADDPRIAMAGYVWRDWVESPVEPGTSVARFGRRIPAPGRGYEWDTPGVRVRFRTDARRVVVKLVYNALHTSTSARNGVGYLLIDGGKGGRVRYADSCPDVVRPVEAVDVAGPDIRDGRTHDYDLIFPYGDSVDFAGLEIDADATLSAPPPSDRPTYLAYGDSVSQGFTASDITHTYTHLLAERNEWQLVNAAIAGRASCADDADKIAHVKADIVTVLMGGNDWQMGVTPEQYGRNMRGFLAGLRKHMPMTPVVVMTSLWVAPDWKPPAAVSGREPYRAALRAAVDELKDGRIYLIEGETLIDRLADHFDRVRVHPNDAGFAQMADHLDAAIRNAGVSVGRRG